MSGRHQYWVPSNPRKQPDRVLMLPFSSCLGLAPSSKYSAAPTLHIVPSLTQQLTGREDEVT